MTPSAGPTPLTPAAASAAVDQAAALLATDPAQALARITPLSDIAPNDPRVRLILGSAQRRLGNHAAALTVLAPLAKAYPRAALTQYELGVALLALTRHAEGVAALRAAAALNRDLPQVWRALGDALFAAGDGPGAERAFAEHARAAISDPRLKPAALALLDGRLDAAEDALRAHILANPGDATALNMLAETYIRRGRHADAEVLLARCLELDPAFDGARFNHANALFQQQKAPAAVAEVERLLARDPRDPAYLNLMAACLSLIGEHNRVNAIHEDLLARYDKQPRIWLNHGHALRTVGRRDQAVAAYKRCIALAPEIGDAYWSLANLKVASFTPDETAAMADQLARSDLAPQNRLHLHYALGKALEDADDYAASFDHYARGAAIRRAETPYDADEATRTIRRSIERLTPAFFAARRDHGSVSDDPIFIIGLPRSGSTLIEQILASHSAVEGTMELPDIGFIARDLGGDDPGALDDLDRARSAGLGDRFIADTRVHRKLGRRFFIDKMPNNFHHIGLIHLILPHARIIDARRHPLGSCFSAFKQHFNQGQSFSYDLIDLGRYYRDYVDLMAHVDAVLPGRVCRVIYEDLVEDTEGEVRRLLDHCGLPFEASCLNFHQNDRPVRTVSSEQVRRPIFRDGLEQWRNYEPWLGPLKTALGPALDNWRG